MPHLVEDVNNAHLAVGAGVSTVDALDTMLKELALSVVSGCVFEDAMKGR